MRGASTSTYFEIRLAQTWYYLQYIELKCVDPDSRQTEIAVCAALPAVRLTQYKR